MTTSWVIRDKATKAVVCETFNRRAVECLNTAKYEAVPIRQYLVELNRRESAMKYRLVQTVEGRLVQTEGEMENVFPAFEVRGFRFTKFNDNPRQRAELQGQPKFTGLTGPMYDGPGFLRYEDPEAYSQLSA